MIAPWKLLYANQRGTSHERNGQPCQDYALGRQVSYNGHPFLIATCADGAGSCSFSDIGASVACRTLIHSLATAIESGLQLTQMDRRWMLARHEDAARQLALESCLRNVSRREFACTVLTAVIGTECAVFAQIGDGAIVIDKGTAYQTVFWPQTGEYANTTNFLTGNDLDQHLMVAQVEGAVRKLAMFTDGLQSLALRYSDRSVHAPFFQPMFDSLRQRPAEDLDASLRLFLASDGVNARTDDDKTLILALSPYER